MAKKKINAKKLLHQKQSQARKAQPIRRQHDAFTPMNHISDEQFVKDSITMLKNVKQADDKRSIANFPAELLASRKATARYLQGYFLTDARLQAQPLSGLKNYISEHIVIRGLVSDYDAEKEELLIQNPILLAHSKQEQGAWNYLPEPLHLANCFSLPLKDIYSASNGVRVSIGDYIMLDALIREDESLTSVAIIDSGLIVTTRQGFETADNIDGSFPRKHDYLFEFKDLPNGDWGLVLNQAGIDLWSRLSERQPEDYSTNLAIFS
ncbi:hypothetical protein [Ligilactobacillus equi]|uniref:Uncharacterized protein n=1 Tax=Ligilactobacillus equi DSM 15833 = JCM 10991 TaxID=1423740 RepID=A0A0R1TFU7_9LACO|nr:hypothetical protein [Ligilactobacillus equi]KRL79486.1 hypothetical protein FC36_GL000471 [Ligilactobacillus equi DSM 15833 = JCM 10991]